MFFILHSCTKNMVFFKQYIRILVVVLVSSLIYYWLWQLHSLYSNGRSLCSPKSDSRGPKQRILSFTYFGAKDKFREGTVHSFHFSIFNSWKLIQGPGTHRFSVRWILYQPQILRKNDYCTLYFHTRLPILSVFWEFPKICTLNSEILREPCMY